MTNHYSTITKKCVGCGSTFQAVRVDQKRCTKGCGRSRISKRGQPLPLEFIGVDGEGETSDDGTHKYVLLSVGDESIHNPDGLGWRETLQFLYDQFLANPNAVYVGYFLAYDFCHWLRGITEREARILLTSEGIASRRRKHSGGNPRPFPVYLGEREWEIDTLNLKRVQIRPGGPEGERNSHKWMTVCDVGPFFQQSFVKTLQSWDSPKITADDKAIILEGKAKRSTARFDKNMIRYNITENRALSAVMEQVNAGLRTAGINLTRTQWFGPGQASQQWLNSIGALTTDEYQTLVPEWARGPIIASYYGGWFEIMRHGHVGNGWAYDINSAYPHAIANLPCLRHGKWRRGNSGNGYSLANVKVYGYTDAVTGPMPYRTDKGNISRPLVTQGWYWTRELEASNNAGLLDLAHTVTLEEVEYLPCDCPPPYRAIADLYLERLKVGKNSAAGKIYKLIYNSAYGKMAQSVGNPKFSNGFNASLITSTCRTMILEAIAAHPNGADNVMMVATDGIVFQNRHPNLELSGTKLGAWDETETQGLTLFMPGLYWDDESRRRIANEQSLTLKSRGISATDLAPLIADIDRQFADGQWATADIPLKFDMVGLKQALARGKWETAGTVNTNRVHTIRSLPTVKRRPEVDRLVSHPHWRFANIASTPYDRTFGDDDLDTSHLGAVLTDDDRYAIMELLNG